MRQGKEHLHNYLCDPSVTLWSVETALQIKNNALHIASPDRTLELSALANSHLLWFISTQPSHKYELQRGNNVAGEGQTRWHCSRSQTALIHFQYLKHHKGRAAKRWESTVLACFSGQGFGECCELSILPFYPCCLPTSQSSIPHATNSTVVLDSHVMAV